MPSKRVVLIDNYDSFTWNLYEYLCKEGADVLVYRNDEITVPDISQLKPDLLFISPGPGHPSSDAGISKECIKYFAGKLPVFGVCMGQQCIFEVFGGKVDYAGEIIHGKTSEIHHDGCRVFKDVPQGVAVTRYHSLAGTAESLPDDLYVTAKTAGGIIMGIRHKKYTVEGVQFHPESILTQTGRLMVRNILRMKGGEWDETDESQEAPSSSKPPSILDEIFARRKADVATQAAMPGFTLNDLETEYFELGLKPSVINLYEKLVNCSKPSVVLAEVKRASPTKGAINLKVNAAKQALKYAKAGASAISVLTEPHWFKGQLRDLVSVRKVLDANFGDDDTRPCVLRKEFIFSRYQILEARLAGADTVLLIVKMLDQKLLRELYEYSVKEMGIEPLVEVNSKDELDRALEINAKVIGVNNRDLHSFTVDLNVTTSLVDHIPEGVILVALSGITGKDDVLKYRAEGVKGLLVGEALMKADDAGVFIQDLIN